MPSPLALAALARRHRVLHHLRQRRLVAAGLRWVDRERWARVPGVRRPCRVRLVQHAAYYLLAQGPEPQLTATVLALCEEWRPEVFYDVGANFGYYTWLVADAMPGVDVVAVEPDPANLSLLRATCARQGHGDRVHVVAAAVTDDTGSTTLVRDLDTGHTGHVSATATPGGPDLRVPTVRLDDLRRPGRAVVKVDVEGAEAQVLRGATQLLTDGAALVIEVSLDGGPAASDVLRTAGYQLLDARTLRPADGSSSDCLALPAGFPAGTLDRLRRRREKALAG